MTNDNLTAAVQGAIDFAYAEEGVLSADLAAEHLRREWGTGLTAHDFEPVERTLIPLLGTTTGQLVRVYYGDITLLGRVGSVSYWQENVELLAGRNRSSIWLDRAGLIQCEVLEG